MNLYKKIHPAMSENYKIFLKDQIKFDLKNYGGIIENSNRENYFLISTPFYLPNTSDNIFSQKTYFKEGNFLKDILPFKKQIQLGKTKLIFFFEDWWGFCNNHEKNEELSGNLISYDIYKWLYIHLSEHNFLSNSCFVSGVSTNEVVQFHNWPIINYNLAFNCFFSYEDIVKSSKKDLQFSNFIFSLNRRARPHRLYTFYKLLESNLLEDSKYSFHFYAEDITEEYTKDRLFIDYMKNKWITNIDERIIEKMTSNFVDTNYSVIKNNNSLDELIQTNKTCFLEVITEFRVRVFGPGAWQHEPAKRGRAGCVRAGQLHESVAFLEI